MRPVLAMLCFLSLTTVAHAVPTCLPGTMADYLALTNGCRFGAITVSNFSYSGFAESVITPPVEVLASDVFVTPSLPFGVSSLRLSFSGGWSGVDISYSAEAEAAWIRQFNLLSQLVGPGVAVLGGNGLFTFVDPFNPFGDTGRLFDTRSFDPISVTTVHVSGSAGSFPISGIGGFDFDVVTPEPTTLLLWAAGATGIGLARWRRRREHPDPAA